MKHSFFLAVLYLMIAAIWVVGADQLILWLSLDPAASARLQTLKDWTFVVVTALLLYCLLRSPESEKHFEARFERSARTDWLPALLFLLLVVVTVIPGVLAYHEHEVARHFGQAAIDARLLAWFSFMLLFALVAGTTGILFWWRGTKTRFWWNACAAIWSGPRYAIVSKSCCGNPWMWSCSWMRTAPSSKSTTAFGTTTVARPNNCAAVTFESCAIQIAKKH